MSTLFIIGLVAIVLGGVSIALDGAFDLPASEWLSATGICAGGATFCFVGGILQFAPLPVWIIAGLVAALIVTGGTSFLMFKLRNSGGAHTTPVQTMIGSKGSVVVPIEPGKFGQINLVVAGETVQMNAVSEEEIPLGQPVRVLGVESATCVRVENLR
ncbi:MAG: NfeD family protein [Propionibacteriaceae bacterium]|jgi:membrane-bound ClpP family serine protease|nr:NfeD family protein [Propionibacteriaceae bacterium]